jgi:hypothetical protein
LSRAGRCSVTTELTALLCRCCQGFRCAFRWMHGERGRVHGERGQVHLDFILKCRNLKLQNQCVARHHCQLPRRVFEALHANPISPGQGSAASDTLARGKHTCHTFTHCLEDSVWFLRSLLHIICNLHRASPGGGQGKSAHWQDCPAAWEPPGAGTLTPPYSDFKSST